MKFLIHTPFLTTAPFLTATLFLTTTLALPQDSALEARSGDTPETAGENAVLALARAGFDDLRQEVIFDDAGDGRLWARGPDWKASFGPGGFTFIPFLGSDAPRNYPVAFEVDRVTLGGEELSFDAQPAATRVGDAVTLGRGAFEETYFARPEGVEQTFVFDSLPALADLRIHMTVTSELAANPADGGWIFENERGHVRYGAATAIDADGNAFALDQRWADGGIEILVPRVQLANARFPLVVDPVVSTFSVTDDSREQIDVDVAYDGPNEVYLIVYQDRQSVFDNDVISVFYNVSLGLLLSPASIDISSADWNEPRVADCFFDETFLCVATVGSTIGSRRIWGRTRSAADGSRGSKFQISTSIDDNISPDVGGFGNDTNTSFDFCVVWQRNIAFGPDKDIVAQGVSSGGSLVGQLSDVSTLPSLDAKPRISRSSGRPSLVSTDHRYMIVWEREESPTNHDIWARVIDYDLDLTGHSRFRAYSFGDALEPDVSTQNTSALSAEPYWVIVFERLYGTDYDINAVVAREGNPDNARNLCVMMDIAVQDEQSDPRIAFDSQDYFVVYKTEAPGGGEDVYMTVLEVVPDGGEIRTGLTERRTALRAPDGTAGAVAIASNWDGGIDIPGTGSASNALALWTAVGPVGSDTEVAGAIVNEVTCQINGWQYCDANANSTGVSAWIQASGLSSPFSNVILEASDMPLGQFGHFIVSNADGFSPNPGGSAGNVCVSGSIGRYNAVSEIGNTGSTGTISLEIDPQSFPHGPAAVAGETWFFQCWVRDGATSNFTNGVAVYFL